MEVETQARNRVQACEPKIYKFGDVLLVGTGYQAAKGQQWDGLALWHGASRPLIIFALIGELCVSDATYASR